MKIKLDSCRICLDQAGFKNIFEEQNSVLISTKIVYCASVQVSEDDVLPKMICSQCLFYLDIAYAFKTECESSDRKLRNSLLQFYESRKNNSEYICPVENQDDQCLYENVKYNLNDIRSCSQIDNIIDKNLVNGTVIVDKIVYYSALDSECDKEFISNSNDLQMHTESLQLDYNSFETNVSDSPLPITESITMEEHLEGVNYFSDKVKSKENLKDKVGRHIAKKITGKLPQRVHQNNMAINNTRLQINEKYLNNRVMRNNKDFDNKNVEDITHNINKLEESNIPTIIPNKIVAVDGPSRKPDAIHRCDSRHDRQEDIGDINCQKPRASTSSEKFKSNAINKKLRVKLKMTLRKNNRIVNVYNNRFKSIKSKQKQKGTFTDELKNPEKELGNKKIKEEFKCDVCDKLFRYRSHLQRHLNKHTGAKFYSCDYCKQKFVNKYNLNVHMSKHTGEFPLKCEICNKGLPNPSLLKRHMTSHTGERQFQCRYCLVKFKQSSSLKSHEKMHLHRPSYQCDICFKVFSYTNSLAAHKRLHFGTQRFCCDICLSTFTRKSSLIRHIGEHTKSKKIKCKLCDLSFHSKGNYNSHLRTHCKYKCEVCGESFRYKNNFNEHLKGHRNKKNISRVVL